jgi:hypothetical protein
VKARGAALQGAIAVGALLLAIVTWLRAPDSGAPGDAVIVDLTAGSVQRILWDDGSRKVELDRERPGQSGVRVRIFRSPSLMAPDAGADAGRREPGRATDAGPAPVRPSDAGPRPDAGARGDAGIPALELAPPAPDRELRGNEAAEKLLEQFSPFTATRALGTLDAAKVRELGLDTGTRRLEVWTPTSHLTFVVSSPVGTGASYLRTEDGRVFVLAGSLVQDLTSASSRLVDRRVHAFRPEDPDRLVVHLGSQARTLLQRRFGGATKITTESRPDTPDVYAQAWAERLVRIVPSDVLGKGETPPEGDPAVELRVEFQQGGKQVGFVELARAGNGWFARSEHTVGWLRVVGRAEALVHDAERVVSTP